MGHLFEQQPKESAKAFAAFSLYLSLGPQRSLAAVSQKLAKCEQLIKRWSAKFDWPARVQAHAAHLALVEREAAEALARVKGVDWVTRQEEHREKEWELRGRLIKLAETAIERWLANAARCGSLEGIARLIDLASQLGRVSSGLPTNRVEVTGEGGGPVRVEVTLALEKIYGEPLPGEVVDVEAKALPEAPCGGPP
jgi:hypothetical protein